MGFISTVEPTAIDPKRWWVHPPIEDVDSLKPKPEKDVLLVVGDGRKVVDDLKAFIALEPPPFDTMCINYSVKIVPWPIQHFIAGDSHMADMQRLAQSMPKGVIRHCWNPQSAGFHVRWHRNSLNGWNGTTANLGLKIGIYLGYLKIVFAGCPMDASGNWYSNILAPNDKKQNKDHRAHLWKWTEIAARPVSRLARSMSGKTAMLLGTPTHKWLWEI